MMRQSPFHGTRGHGARRTAMLAALAGMVLSLVFFADAVAVAQKPKIFGIWIGIDRNSRNFGKWQNKPNTTTPEFTAWGAEQSREQGRLGVELPTPGACEPINPVQFLGGGLFPTQDRKSTRLNSSHLVISYDVFC